MKTGTPMLTLVKRIKQRGDYHPAFEFWKQLREGIQEYHASGMPRNYLSGPFHNYGHVFGDMPGF
jgi:hypothetical protein